MGTADPSPDAPRAEPDLGHRAESMASSLGKNKVTMRESVMGGEATTGQPESGKSLLSHIAGSFSSMPRHGQRPAAARRTSVPTTSDASGKD